MLNMFRKPVLIAIKFDNQFPFKADKIDNVNTHGMLPTETASV